MDDAETDTDTRGAGSTAMLRRLRSLICVEADLGGDARTAGWRDDLRLFALTWAAGFMFFMIVLA